MSPLLSMSWFNEGFELVKKRQRVAMAAPDDLFKVNSDAVKQNQAKARDSTVL